MDSYEDFGPDAHSRLMPPAIGLMVAAVFGLLVQTASLMLSLVQMLGFNTGKLPQNEMMANYLGGGIGIVFGVIGLLISAFILFAAVCMMRSRFHGVAVAGTIVAMVPCISPCCCLGLPIGIWALIVLLEDEVKAAFQ